MMVQTTANVNIRAGAGTGFQSIGVAPNGTRGAITGTPVSSGGFTWYPVKMEGFAAGWIAGSYLRTLSITATPESGSAATATRTPTRTPTSAPGGIQIGSTVRTTDYLNMRTGAGTSNSVIAVVPPGTNGTVLAGPTAAGGFQWFRVQFASVGTGWVVSQYLQLVSVSSVGAPNDAPGSSESLPTETATQEPPVEPTATATTEPEPTLEIIPTATVETVLEQAPPTATIDEGSQPLPIVRIQRTDGSTGGEVLVDEDETTVWYAPGMPSAQAAVFVADLDSEQWISTIRWQTAPEGLSGQLYLSISSDGQTWTDLDLTSVVTDGSWSTLELNASTVYVRFAFIAIDDTPDLGGIAEVELWP
jgi:uncharacterized protein YraI